MTTIKMVALPFTFLAATLLGGCVGAEPIEDDEADEAVAEVVQAAQYGAYSQVNCNAYATTGTSTCTTGSIVPHSTDHWLRTRVNCNWGKASYILYDIANGQTVASGSCNGSSTTSGWKTTYGLYGEYKIKTTATAPASAWGYVANCTSGCVIY